MTTDLIVLAFDNTQAAFEVRRRLIQLQRQHLIRLADAAVCVRRADGKLYIKQVSDLAAEGALGGAFWGLMAGILFWMPLLGMALGSLLGALRGSLTEYGISEDFIKEVARSIEPNQSALFLLVVEATTDRVVDQIRGWKPRVIRTNLSREQERRLRDHFSEANRRDSLGIASNAKTAGPIRHPAAAGREPVESQKSGAAPAGHDLEVAPIWALGMAPVYPVGASREHSRMREMSAWFGLRFVVGLIRHSESPLSCRFR